MGHPGISKFRIRVKSALHEAGEICGGSSAVETVVVIEDSDQHELGRNVLACLNIRINASAPPATAALDSPSISLRRSPLRFSNPQDSIRPRPVPSFNFETALPLVKQSRDDRRTGDTIDYEIGGINNVGIALVSHHHRLARLQDRKHTGARSLV